MNGQAAPDIGNERIKLTATAISNVGVGFILAGFVAPLLHGDLFSVRGFLVAIVSAAVGWRIIIQARDHLGRLHR
jgi:hypothetical protein